MKHQADPPRWSEAPANALERKAGELMQAIAEQPVPDYIDNRVARRKSRARWTFWVLLGLTIPALSFAALYREQLSHWLNSTTPQTPIVPVAAPVVQQETPPVEASVPAPLPARPILHRLRPKLPPPAPVAAVSTLEEETELIHAALDELKASHVDQALHTLEEYRRRFPHGTLSQEADRVTLDAMLQNADEPGALAWLDAARGLSDVERHVLKAELLSHAKQYSQSQIEFEQALQQKLSRTLEERARYGLAACLSNLGEEAKSKAELRDYLQRFPQGRYAAAVRRAVGQP